MIMDVFPLHMLCKYAISKRTYMEYFLEHCIMTDDRKLAYTEQQHFYKVGGVHPSYKNYHYKYEAD